VILTLSILNVFEDGSKVTPAILKEKGILKKLDKRTIVKFLGDGEVNKKLELDGFIYSESAKEKLEKSGAKIS
jgi:large subunit ribosomal protein L15